MGILSRDEMYAVRFFVNFSHAGLLLLLSIAFTLTLMISDVAGAKLVNFAEPHFCGIRRVL